MLIQNVCVQLTQLRRSDLRNRNPQHCATAELLEKDKKHTISNYPFHSNFTVQLNLITFKTWLSTNVTSEK